MIPMLDLRKEYEFLKRDIDEAIQQVMAHQQWINGPEVKRFEEEAARYLGSRFAIGLNSGTDALVIGLRAISYIRTGRERFSDEDEIITTPFTFTATGESILRAGAKPVFVDIGEDYNISPVAIKKAITENTKGIVVVHLYGNPCKMDDIMSIAKENNLFVLEDVAQAFGTKYRGRKAGTIGDVGAFSFFPSKNLGAFGDGGMICTDNEEIMNFSTYLKNHGGRDKYNVEFCGYNSRLDTIQAAILLKKLAHIDEFIERRRENARIYIEGLSGMKDIKIPVETEKGFHTYHQFTIRVLNGKRDLLSARLREEGISTMIYYPIPLNKMKVFENNARAFELRLSEEFSKEVLSLPIGPMQGREVTENIVKKIREIMDEL
ncbi:MAG: DegT/DnrJ/EryC1/StrS family aminotransferase [Myxococcota bacterium]